MPENKIKIFEELTSLVDGEITNKARVQLLNESLERDKEKRFEFNLQKSIKGIIRDRLTRKTTPVYLRDGIIAEIKSRLPEKESRINSITGNLKTIFLVPRTAFAAAIILVGFLLFLPILDNVDLSASDMFTQAESNFDRILAGTLIPQKLCNSSEEVKDFFNNAGVQYATVVPEFKDWNILGAVVSNENGEKLAHHVYTDIDGHVVYLYQVCEDQLTEKKLLELSPYLLSKCKTKRFIKFESDSHSTYLFLYNNNIFALVTNDDDSKIEKKFIAGLLSN